MPTIEDQLAIEDSMIAKGIESYKRQKEAALAAGRGADTGFARRLLEEYIEPLAEELSAIVHKKGPGMRARALVHLKDIECDKAIFIALRNIFNAFHKPVTPVAVANDIGKMVEDEIRFSRFSEKYKAYYKEIMDDFKRKGTKNYRYMHRVLTHTANSNDDGWTPWAVSERVDVGLRLLDVILKHTDLLHVTRHTAKGKTVVNLEPSDEALEFVSKYDDAASLLHPRHMPCIIKPDDWTDLDQGGYYSPQLRQRTRLVLTNNRHHRRLLKKVDLSTVMQAVNGAQHVGWRVNHRVLEVARAVWAKNLKVGMPSTKKLEPEPCPIDGKKKDEMSADELKIFLEWKRGAAAVYTAEKERVGASFQASSIIQSANTYAEYNAFWYVWTLDFRGRMYTTTSGFSPQGPDLAKGLITFSEGKALGVRGVFWLKVHGANRYGFDKKDYPVRAAWVDERHDLIMQAAADPLGHIEFWSKADKPYQFLAFCFEYKEMMDGRLVGRKPEEFVSYLPVGLDGSCNGLQHFSAMLRDARGGRATNLIAGDEPSDIYAEVAAVCLAKIQAEKECPILARWNQFASVYGDGKLPRSVAKRPVMTMPYGSTRQSCTTYIHVAIVETDPMWFGANASFAAATALTPLLWSSIGEVVVAAREGMDWLKKCANVMSKHGLGITWRTRDGFVVHMFERKLESVQIDTVLAGRFQAVVGNYTDELSKHGQRNGVAPNFVHSQDGAHLRATIIRALQRGITSLALIHDDYGTHAADTDTLHEVIRECFVEQYTEFDPLGSFKEWQEAISKVQMPALPPSGNLDITEVLRSPFFFG